MMILGCIISNCINNAYGHSGVVFNGVSDDAPLPLSPDITIRMNETYLSGANSLYYASSGFASLQQSLQQALCTMMLDTIRSPKRLTSRSYGTILANAVNLQLFKRGAADHVSVHYSVRPFDLPEQIITNSCT